jgi:hypothetical protein
LRWRSLTATLAYKIAKTKCRHNKTASEAIKDEEFHKEFVEKRDYLKGLDVALIEIPNPLELYLFEVYCTMMVLKTGTDDGGWNTFKTH